jgi:protein TonB
MQQPEHDLRPFQVSAASPRRFVSIGMVAILHLAVIYALASGLASQMIDKLPDDIKADIVKEKPPDQPKTPPPPPPDLVKPPPPFVPPPDIVVANEAPVTNTITVTNTPPPVAAPPKASVSSPVSIGRPHSCGQRYYPALATRLGHEGTTILSFTVGTDGGVHNVTVAQPSGFPELDQAAIPCASSWTYKPAEENGAPVEKSWQAKVTWKLNGG